MLISVLIAAVFGLFAVSAEKYGLTITDLAGLNRQHKYYIYFDIDGWEQRNDDYEVVYLIFENYSFKNIKL